MLENALTNTNDNSDLKEKTVQLRQMLAELQLKIRENKLPVIIIFEGWSASGIPPCLLTALRCAIL